MADMDMVGGGNAGAQILDDRPGGRLDFSSNGQAAAAAFHNARSDGERLEHVRTLVLHGIIDGTG